MKKIFLPFLILLGIKVTFAQKSLPILRANTNPLTIKDGNVWRKNYWSASPEYKLDIYTADKTMNHKTVTFYSDIDSISFYIKPKEKYNFIVLLNDKDSCFTQIKSGITYTQNNLPLTSDTIPFTLTSHNNIAIPILLNKKDSLSLMFHTAERAITLTQKTAKKITEIEDLNNVQAKSWGGVGNAKYFKNNTIQIGSLQWDSLVVWIDKLSGPNTGGKFGPNLFNDKVLEINYDKSILIVHSTLPQIDKTYQKMNLLFRQNDMFLEGTLKIDEHYLKNMFLIHSGYGGSILIDNQFANKNKLSQKLPIVKESELKDSFGNILKTKKAIVSEINFGNIAFKNTPISFFEGKIGGQSKSIMGSDLLKRFNIILDLQQANIYLKTNQLSNTEYSDI